jgi:hypothetical protein
VLIPLPDVSRIQVQKITQKRGKGKGKLREKGEGKKEKSKWKKGEKRVNP